MYKTPRGNREHIVFYGRRNVGKSSLINKLIGQELSIVSDVKGTTADPVAKSIELLPYGPVTIIDTAGIDDLGQLGELRVEKTMATLEKADLAVYVMDDLEDDYLEKMQLEFKKRNIPYLLVLNKADLLEDSQTEILETSIENSASIDRLRQAIIDKLELYKEETSLLGDLLDYGSKLVLVIDIDSAAPKGRLILPQVQVLRDAIDNGLISVVLKNTELEGYLRENDDVDLIITDSKIFKEVEKLVPDHIKLTGFSIIMARDKGDLPLFVRNVRRLEELKELERPKILIAESCSHAVSHEDIGRVKIPGLLRKLLGNEDIDLSFKAGDDFSLDKDYDFVIHCGGCMANRKSMENRIRLCQEKDIPISNYGIFLAYSMGILDRAVEIFGL